MTALGHMVPGDPAPPPHPCAGRVTDVHGYNFDKATLHWGNIVAMAHMPRHCSLLLLSGCTVLPIPVVVVQRTDQTIPYDAIRIRMLMEHGMKQGQGPRACCTVMHASASPPPHHLPTTLGRTLLNPIMTVQCSNCHHGYHASRCHTVTGIMHPHACMHACSQLQLMLMQLAIMANTGVK